jgi:hypothetical protein
MAYSKITVSGIIFDARLYTEKGAADFAPLSSPACLQKQARACAVELREIAAIINEGDIVYRGLEAPAASPRNVEHGEWCRELVPDAVQLFRCSALMTNAKT